MKLHLRKVIKVISVSYNSKKQSKTLHCFLKQLFNYVPHVSKMLGHNKGKTLLDNELLLHSTQMIICNPGCLIKRPMMPFQRKITPSWRLLSCRPGISAPLQEGCEIQTFPVAIQHFLPFSLSFSLRDMVAFSRSYTKCEVKGVIVFMVTEHF